MLCDEQSLLFIVEQLLTESNLISEAFSRLFFERNPEFDQKTIIRILARMSIEQQRNPHHGPKLQKTLKGIIYDELLDKRVDKDRAAELASDEMVIRNFWEGLMDRPAWARIEKPVKKLIAQRKPFD